MLADLVLFMEGLNAPVMSKDDLDEFPNVSAVFLLDDGERVIAEDLLIDKLAEDDLRAVRPLVELRCARAVPALRERVATSPSARMRDLATWAVAELAVDRGLPAIVERLRTGDVDARLDAVSDLYDHDDPRAEQVLDTAAFTDPAGVVRNAALDMLFARRDILLDAESFRSTLDFVRRRMLSPLPAVRAEAEAELRHLFMRLAAGESRDQLGLTWRADREEGPLREFVLSKFGDDAVTEGRRYAEWKASGRDISELRVTRPPFDIRQLAGLRGWERKWVEDVLLSELHDGPGPVHAVAVLDVRRAIQPLRELRATTEHPRDVENALRQLDR